MASWVKLSGAPIQSKEQASQFLGKVREIQTTPPIFSKTPAASENLINLGELIRGVAEVKQVISQLPPSERDELLKEFIDVAKRGVIVSPSSSSASFFRTSGDVQAAKRAAKQTAAPQRKPAQSADVAEKPAVKKEVPQAKRKGGLEEALGNKDAGRRTVPGKGGR